MPTIWKNYLKISPLLKVKIRPVRLPICAANRTKKAADKSPGFSHLLKIKIMRRFPYFVGPLVGLVLLFFFLKALFIVLFGAAVLGMGAMAFKAMRSRHHYGPMHVAAIQHRQPVPIDGRRSEPAFDWMPQGRIIEVI
jgi:hypothetical protein